MDVELIKGCTDCKLHSTRIQVVLPRGSPYARVVFIGEAPGANEDIQGKPFVGRAGKLLDEWIAYLGLTEDQYAITNVVWCRPPENRFPSQDEVESCKRHLMEYLATVKPRYVVTLGKLATEFMFGSKIRSMTAHAGEILVMEHYEFCILFHPAYFLRNHGDWKPMLQNLKKELKS
jgi:uracil-DNA glycosylase family 4